MHKFYRRPLFCIALLGLMSSACSGSKLYPEPAVATSDVLAIIDADTPKADSMRITAKVDYVDGETNKRVVGRDFVISAEQPNYLRITLSSFDKALSTLVTDGEHLLLIDAMQNVFVIGRATAKNLSTLLPLYMSAQDIIRLLSGEYPQDGLLEPSLQNTDITWNPAENGYERRLKLKDGSEQSVFYSYPEGDIFKIAIHKDGDIRYLFEARDFTVHPFAEQQSMRLPKTVVFKMKAEKTDLRLRIENYDLDPSFSEGVFTLVPPLGYEIIFLDGDKFEDDREDLSAEPQTDVQTEPQTDVQTEPQTDASLTAPIDLT